MKKSVFVIVTLLIAGFAQADEFQVAGQEIDVAADVNIMLADGNRDSDSVVVQIGADLEVYASSIQPLEWSGLGWPQAPGLTDHRVQSENKVLPELRVHFVETFTDCGPSTLGKPTRIRPNGRSTQNPVVVTYAVYNICR